MNKKKSIVSLWEHYLSKEIGIEFKACLYFFAILFYYCIYRLCIGNTVAEILHMTEMIFLTYVIGYVQVYLLWNFDEAESIGIKEIIGILVCTTIYTLASLFFHWLDGKILVTVGFAGYIIFLYICVYLVYKTRRKIDNKILNDDLALFKAKNNK